MRPRSILSILTVTAFLVSTSLPVWAEEVTNTAASNEAAATTETETNADGLTPAQEAKKEALTDKVTAIMKGLDLNQVQHFTVIYANYMILSMVKAVRNDVAKAVEGCATNNNEIASEMNSRYNTWLQGLEQPIKDSETNINNMIVAQNYLPKAQFEEMFALVDETRAVNASEFQKTPVTTPEACKYMLGKMDETQKSMAQMLQTTLVTYPDLLKNNQK